MKRNDCQKCTAPKRTLPAGAVLAGTTPVLNEKTVPPAMLHRHLAPKGTAGLLSALKGEVVLVYESSGEHVAVTPDLPAVVEPGRYHHVELHPGAEFKIEFYTIPECCAEKEQEGPRPGEAYLHCPSCAAPDVSAGRGRK